MFTLLSIQISYFVLVCEAIVIVKEWHDPLWEAVLDGEYVCRITPSLPADETVQYDAPGNLGYWVGEFIFLVLRECEGCRYEAAWQYVTGD